jgi:hypothetical protein
MIGSIPIPSAKTFHPASRGEPDVDPIPSSGPAGVNEQISFVLSHPAMSAWLKDALRAAITVDPISAMNDVEILNLIIRQRADQFVQAGYHLEP